jgi:hypothetical protein
MFFLERICEAEEILTNSWVTAHLRRLPMIQSAPDWTSSLHWIGDRECSNNPTPHRNRVKSEKRRQSKPRSQLPLPPPPHRPASRSPVPSWIVNRGDGGTTICPPEPSAVRWFPQQGQPCQLWTGRHRKGRYLKSCMFNRHRSLGRAASTG